MLASDIVRQVSWDLNDQEPGYEYARWPAAALSSYLQEAVVNVSYSLSDDFQSEVVVELRPGNVWQEVCEDCERITRILGVCDESGERIIKELRRMDDDERLRWTGNIPKDCPGNAVLEGYMTSRSSHRQFKVFAPVSYSDGTKHYVLVQCFSIPNVSESGCDIPTEICPIVKQWMLYRALSLDSENNPTVIQLAAAHMSEYHKLFELAVQRKMMEEAKHGGPVRSVSDSSAE